MPKVKFGMEKYLHKTEKYQRHYPFPFKLSTSVAARAETVTSNIGVPDCLDNE